MNVCGDDMAVGYALYVKGSVEDSSKFPAISDGSKERQTERQVHGAKIKL